MNESNYMKRAIEITSTLEKRFNPSELALIFDSIDPRAVALMMRRVVIDHYKDGVDVTINKLLVAIADMAVKATNGSIS